MKLVAFLIHFWNLKLIPFSLSCHLPEMLNKVGFNTKSSFSCQRNAPASRPSDTQCLKCMRIFVCTSSNFCWEVLPKAFRNWGWTCRWKAGSTQFTSPVEFWWTERHLLCICGALAIRWCAGEPGLPSWECFSSREAVLSSGSAVRGGASRARHHTCLLQSRRSNL